MKKNKLLSVLSILSILIPLSFSILACKAKPKKPKTADKIKTVSLTEAKWEEIQNTLELKGTFVPSDKLDVKTEVEGKILSATAQEGQNVSMGDPLATIDATKIKLQLDKSRKELKETEARIEAGMNLLKIIPAANAPAAVAVRPEDAEESPSSENGDSDEVGDESHRPALKESAETTKDQESSTPQNVSGSSKNDLVLRAEESTMDRIKAEIALNEKKLESETINAGIAGFISRKNVTDGSVVGLGEVLYQIVRLDPILLSVFVSKDMVSQFKKGDHLEVFSDELPGQALPAEVIFIAAEPDPQNKNYEVKISLSNTQQKLKGGMNGKIFTPLSETKESIQIPLSAALEKNGKAYVYVVEGDLAVKREVSLGRKTADKVEVKKGIREGEKVVSKGLNTLVEEQEYIKTES
ncbi:MAG: efflux RND transporter periplasmic adaptor subunit [Deltaproteobacteria bacterium]|nr:efflux RND transporter periplasmic adaptor subunit [Deltaproteobacteria bacterium]